MTQDEHSDENPEAVLAAESTGDPVELTADEQMELLEAESSSVVVTYSGQDFDVYGLVRRLRNDDILIPTFGHDDERIAAAGFQRSFVWRKSQMDRFIESLLSGYPIPGIFLVRQIDRRYLVLDGQQRLRTLAFFYDGVYGGREFTLSNVTDEYKGLTYKSLSDDQRRLLDDTFLQATIVESDGSPGSLEAIYQIFERLNSGGTQLTPHEIRVALYAGSFIDYLESLNNLGPWRELYGKKSPRLRDQELVLRILALHMSATSYRRPLKTFLNGVVAQNRDLKSLDTELLGQRFREASQHLLDSGGRSLLRLEGYQVNAAMTEAIYVGLMRRLDHGTAIDPVQLQEAFIGLRSDASLRDAVSRATADEERVRARLEAATAAFAQV